MNLEGLELCAIGHSKQRRDQFLNLLRQRDMKVLVDVRRFPGSRKFPHFSRENPPSSAAAREVEYHWVKELGGRRSNRGGSTSDNDGWNNKSFRNYADCMKTKDFRIVLNELVELATSDRAAIMCSESVFWRCHRRLVSAYVVTVGGHVEHMVSGGHSKPRVLSRGAIIQSQDPLILTYLGDPKLFN